MPITADEWNSKKIYSRMEKTILGFLEKNHKYAYTSDEVFDQLQNISHKGKINHEITHSTVKETLDKLVGKSKIKSKELTSEGSSKKYYRYEVRRLSVEKNPKKTKFRR